MHPPTHPPTHTPTHFFPHDNTALSDSGVSVFLDANPAAPPNEKWKMACSNAVYGSPDGITWHALTNHSPVKAEDDTKPTARFDPRLNKYVVYVRRDLRNTGRAGDVRTIGRCVTSDFTDWESDVPGGDGCPVVFAVDALDPPELDVYTNAWTPYPSIEDPAAHFFFPSFYHHFSDSAPWGFGNDGLLDTRLVVSSDGANLSYVPGARSRAPFVPLGVNRCGPTASSPSVKGGWCSPTSGIEASVNQDTSQMYMADGWLPSNDGESIYLYIAGLPCTHGEILAQPLWGNNTGVRVLQLRKDGFTSVVAPYAFNLAGGPSALPSLTTKSISVPTGCPPGPPDIMTSCAYEYPDDHCPPSSPPFACESDQDCRSAVPGRPNITCHGKVVRCVDKTCASDTPGGQMCVDRVPTGGPSIGLNVETSVAGCA
jgi:hypothetical protein